MTDRIQIGDLNVARGLADFAEQEALPGTGVTPEAFWAGLDRLVHELGPKNRALLAKRDKLPAESDACHRARRGSGDEGQEGDEDHEGDEGHGLIEKAESDYSSVVDKVESADGHDCD